MSIAIDHSWGWGRDAMVVWRLPLSEFREHVEWLEGIRPRDGATRDLRAALDRIDPAGSDEEGT